MPRCEPCGTPEGNPVRPCSRCEAKDQHTHLRLFDRWEQSKGEAVLCRSCLATLGWRGTTLLAALVGESRRSQGASDAAVSR